MNFDLSNAPVDDLFFRDYDADRELRTAFTHVTTTLHIREKFFIRLHEIG